MSHLTTKKRVSILTQQYYNVSYIEVAVHDVIFETINRGGKVKKTRKYDTEGSFNTKKSYVYILLYKYITDYQKFYWYV